MNMNTKFLLNLVVLSTTVTVSFFICASAAKAEPAARQILNTQLQSGATLEKIAVWPGKGMDLDFIATNERIIKAWLDDPTKFTLDFDGCLGSSSGGQNRGCNARVAHLRQISTPKIPGFTYAASTTLTLMTDGSQGVKRYKFELLPGKGQAKYSAVNVLPDVPSLEIEGQQADVKSVEKGLAVAASRQLVSPSLEKKVHAFLAQVKNGQSIKGSADAANIKLATILQLAKLGVSDSSVRADNSTPKVKDSGAESPESKPKASESSGTPTAKLSSEISPKTVSEGVPQSTKLEIESLKKSNAELAKAVQDLKSELAKIQAQSIQTPSEAKKSISNVPAPTAGTMNTLASGTVESNTLAVKTTEQATVLAPYQRLKGIPFPMKDGSTVPASELLNAQGHVLSDLPMRKKYGQFISELTRSGDIDKAVAESQLPLNDVQYILSKDQGAQVQPTEISKASNR